MRFNITISKKIIGILIIVWVTVWLFLWVFNIDVFNIKGKVNARNCEEELKVKLESINGKVVDKFQDERGIRFFKYTEGADTLTSHWALLGRGFYDYLEVGDSIRKDAESLDFIVYRSEQDTLYKIDFDCN